MTNKKDSAMYSGKIGAATTPIHTENAKKYLLANHQWVTPWSINISTGLSQTVSNLLSDVEGILSSKTPALGFLRISEEYCVSTSDIDLSDIYRRQLRIFIQAKTKHVARDEALIYVARQAVRASQELCVYCGEKLEKSDIDDDDLQSTYVFMPKRPASLKKSETYSRFVSWCMSCAHKKWIDEKIEKQKKTQDAWSVIPSETGVSDDAFLFEDDDDDDAFLFEDTDDNEYIAKITAATNAARNIEESEIEEIENVVKKIAVFNTDDIDKLERNSIGVARDQASRISGLIKRLRGAGAMKDLVQIPDGWLNYCDSLDARFPNFKGPIDYIRHQMALSSVSDHVIRIPPMLFLGPPGIGKSELALTIANDLDTDLLTIDAASLQSGAGLSGSEGYWSTSQTGSIFDSVVFSRVANPIIILDELDKARNDKSYNALSVLHQVLEPRQARAYHDLSVPSLTIDVSNVIWIATANNAELIEKPILDRFVCFNIEAPGEAQMPAIVKNQYQQFLDTHPSGEVFDKEMAGDVLCQLCTYHPRLVRKILNMALGRAALNTRTHLTIEDIKASETEDKKQNGIGFSAEIG